MYQNISIIGVKHWLRYLILFIFAVLYYDGTAKVDTSIGDHVEADCSANVVSCDTGFGLPEAEWCLPPRHVSFANSQRLQSSVKRITSTQRYIGGFYKTGKDSDAGSLQFILYNNLISYSFFIKPAHRLISLGKLII